MTLQSLFCDAAELVLFWSETTQPVGHKACITVTEWGSHQEVGPYWVRIFCPMRQRLERLGEQIAKEVVDVILPTPNVRVRALPGQRLKKSKV